MSAERTSSLRERMLAEHAAIEELTLSVLRAMRDGADAEGVRASWCAFEVAFGDHLDREDRVVIPSLYRRAPRKARGISEEHRYLRGRMTELSTLTARGALTVDALTSFIEELRAHIRSEERAIYEWADAAMAEPERAEILRRLAAV